MSTCLAAALLLAAAACTTDGATPTTETPQLPSPEEAGRVPVADEQGQPVGYILESDVEAIQSEGDGGRVSVYDDDTGELVGYFEIGPDGGYRPLDE